MGLTESGAVSDMLVPSVIEQTARGERQYDLYSRLFKERVVFVTGPIDDAGASVICAQLLFLESLQPRKDISLYVNSPGGSITDALAIYDTMQYIKPDVATVAVGQVHAMAALLVAAGTLGKRHSLQNASFLLRQPERSFQGQATDIAIHALDVLADRSRLSHLLTRHTGQKLSTIETAIERDRFLSTAEARCFGLIDVVLCGRKHQPSPPAPPSPSQPRNETWSKRPAVPTKGAKVGIPIPFPPTI